MSPPHPSKMHTNARAEMSANSPVVSTDPHSLSHKLPLVSVQHEGRLRGFWFLPLCCILLQHWLSLGKNTAYRMKPRAGPTLAGQASEKASSFRLFLLPLRVTLSRHFSLSDFKVCLFYICAFFSKCLYNLNVHLVSLVV